MICHRCLLRATRQQKVLSSSHRAFNASARLGISSSDQTSSPSTAAQPYTNPIGTSPVEHGLPPSKSKKENAIVLSSMPAGTPLKGINYLKNKPDPVAMDDSEYPSWLWEVLKSKKADDGAGEAGDLYSKSKTKRKAAKKAKKLSPDGVVQKVPIYEQSIDMPAGDGTLEGALAAETARQELSKAMREKRRATIKETNFLKTMT